MEFEVDGQNTNFASEVSSDEETESLVVTFNSRGKQGENNNVTKETGESAHENEQEVLSEGELTSLDADEGMGVRKKGKNDLATPVQKGDTSKE